MRLFPLLVILSIGSSCPKPQSSLSRIAVGRESRNASFDRIHQKAVQILRKSLFRTAVSERGSASEPWQTLQ